MSASTATVTALASALVLGASAVADQRSTKRVKTRKTLSPAMLAARNQSLRPLALALACGVSPHVTRPAAHAPAPSELPKQGQLQHG